MKKQKNILGYFKRTTALLLVPIVLLSLIGPFLGTPKVFAITDAEINAKGQKYCSPPPQFSNISKDQCLAAYRAGYKNQNNPDFCNRFCQPNVYDKGKGEGGVDQQETSGPKFSKSVVETRAKTYCDANKPSGMSTDDCVQAYMFGFSAKEFGGSCSSRACGVVLKAGQGEVASVKAEATNDCKDEKDKTACVAGFFAKKNGKTVEEACGSLNGDAKKSCEAGHTKGARTLGGGDSDDPTKAPDSNPDCDVKFFNPLSWIICPIIDMGANFTDAVFTTFVRPLLEDIPIGSSPDDGGYRAWQGFRALGNIMLVGCLLAIVYAQARGDK